ncbi:unnamed protein product [Aureobasidium pullulans]|nr:unnamed protein product [Aureobasidium pullulans]
MSDNELDAELLALAGDDSSDDERTDNRAAQRSSPLRACRSVLRARPLSTPSRCRAKAKGPFICCCNTKTKKG